MFRAVVHYVAVPANQFKRQFLRFLANGTSYLVFAGTVCAQHWLDGVVKTVQNALTLRDDVS
jgi:hypothetical protein